MRITSSDIPITYVDKLIQNLKDEYDIDFTGYNRNFLRRRISSRMNRTGTATTSAYERLLTENPQELSELLQNLTINVSEFMRNPDVFTYLESNILPKITENTNNRPLRFWTAGCSKGEEPYSLAIVLKKSGLLNNRSTTIIATDIDQFALDIAKEGTYNSSSLKNLSPANRNLYFNKTNNGKYKIADEIKKVVLFKKHDVVRGPDLGKFDIIFCRNVSIYFTKALQDKMYERFCDELYRGGYLVTGKTEMPPTRMSGRFKVVDPDSRIYQKAA